MSEERKKASAMTRKELQAVPHRTNWHEKVVCSSIIILPQRTKHDSGYAALDFVAVDREDYPVCTLSGCSDVIHIGGIGGHNYEWDVYTQPLPMTSPCVSWSIDCLWKSKLLRIFASGHDLIAGDSLSSFEIWVRKREVKND